MLMFGGELVLPRTGRGTQLFDDVGVRATHAVTVGLGR